MGAVFTFEPASTQDFEALLALRLRAMRESLERVGRYDEQRARERFTANFDPAQTQHIVVRGRRVGFVALLVGQQVLKLDHLYLEPGFEGQGLGSQVLQWACAQADAARCPIELMALKHSVANRFYLKHGFVVDVETEWDIHYRRPALLASTDCSARV
jgi:GNAT superfamily N-acetyltransferase